MRRYVLPGGLLVLAAAILPLTALVGWDRTWPDATVAASTWVYALGAVVWSFQAVRATPPLWPHLFAAWVPPAAPALMMWFALGESDAAALGFFAFAPAIFVPVLASMVATFLLLLRMTWPPPGAGDLSDQ